MKDVIGEVIAEDAALHDRREVVTAAPVATYDELRQQLADVSNERDEAVSRRDMIHKQLSAWQGLASERLDMLNASEARNGEALRIIKLLKADGGFFTRSDWESIDTFLAQSAPATDEQGAGS